jgi:hypothetical protein
MSTRYDLGDGGGHVGDGARDESACDRQMSLFLSLYPLLFCLDLAASLLGQQQVLLRLGWLQASSAVGAEVEEPAALVSVAARRHHNNGQPQRSRRG